MQGPEDGSIPISPNGYSLNYWVDGLFLFPVVECVRLQEGVVVVFGDLLACSYTARPKPDDEDGDEA